MNCYSSMINQEGLGTRLLGAVAEYNSSGSKCLCRYHFWSTSGRLTWEWHCDYMLAWVKFPVFFAIILFLLGTCNIVQAKAFAAAVLKACAYSFFFSRNSNGEDSNFGGEVY